MFRLVINEELLHFKPSQFKHYFSRFGAILVRKKGYRYVVVEKWMMTRWTVCLKGIECSVK